MYDLFYIEQEMETETMEKTVSVITRAVIYVAAALVGLFAMVLGMVRGEGELVGLGVALLGTNGLAVFNIPAKDSGDAAAE